MLTLLTYPSTQYAFSLSPFCVKAALLLTYAGQRWQREDLVDPRKMPYGKLPVLRTTDRLVADSESIRAWLEAKGAEFDRGLTDREKAQAQAFCRMAEEHLYFQVVQDRWANDAVWPTIRETYFGGIPAVLRKLVTGRIRKSVISGLDFQGVGRFTDADCGGRVERDLEAIRQQLGGKAFLMADHPTSADFSVAPILAAMGGTPVETDLTRRITQDETLKTYIENVEKAVPLS